MTPVNWDSFPWFVKQPTFFPPFSSSWNKSLLTRRTIGMLPVFFFRRVFFFISSLLHQVKPKGGSWSWHEHNVWRVTLAVVGRCVTLRHPRFKAVCGAHASLESSPRCSGALVSPVSAEQHSQAGSFCLHAPAPCRCLNKRECANAASAMCKTPLRNFTDILG